MNILYRLALLLISFFVGFSFFLPTVFAGEVIVQQILEEEELDAEGVCQTLTGLSGTLHSITLKIKFSQKNSFFYPALATSTGARPAISFGRHDFDIRGSAGLCATTGVGTDTSLHDAGLPMTMTGYDSDNTTDFQTITFTLKNPVELNSSYGYIIRFSLPRNQFLTVQGSDDDSYSGGALYYSDKSPWTLDDLVSDMYFKLEGPDSEPVIIVPGILGTRLNRASDDEEVWPNASKMRGGGDAYLDDLILGVSGQIDDVTSIEVGSVVDSVFGVSVYEGLVEGLDYDGQIFVSPYDWRKDLSLEVSRFDSVLDAAIASSTTGKVNIVAHSMGGLLVKEYFRQNNEADLINKVVFVGTPHLGAPKAFKALNYGDDFGFSFFAIGLNVDRSKKISQNMPGVYQLLPSQRYFQVNGGYVKDYRNDQNKVLDFSETQAFMQEDLNDSRNGLLLSRGNAFHQSLDSFSLPAENVYALVGCNQKTISEFYLYDNGKVDMRLGNGDGTVPLVSAASGAISGQTYYATSDLKHRTLVVEDEPLSLISSIISGNNLDLPSEISTDISECSKFINKTDEIVASTHSPVDLHVYDDRGNHTGPLTNGDVELGIPGSDYFSLGENNFVVLPAGGNYRTVVDAYDAGSFDLKIKQYSGFDIVKSTNYLNVPIAVDTLVSEVVIDSSNSVSPLKIDEAGDGAFEKVVAPTAVVSGSNISDVTPPSISFVASSTLLRSEQFSFELGVTDSDSGVSLVEVLFDDRVISPTSTVDLFFEDLGSHLITITTYDKAGNVRIATSSVEVIATVDSTLADLERIFDLGFITKKNAFKELKQKLKKAIKIEKKLVKLEAKDSEKKKIIKKIEKLEKRFDKKLMKQFTKLLTKYSEKGILNNEGLKILEEDINFVLEDN